MFLVRARSPGAWVEFSDLNLQLLVNDEADDLHNFYFSMIDAAENDERDLDLPLSYANELEKHGFVNVTEKIISLSLDKESAHDKGGLHEAIIRNWSEGFEA